MINKQRENTQKLQRFNLMYYTRKPRTQKDVDSSTLKSEFGTAPVPALSIIPKYTHINRRQQSQCVNI